MIVLHNDRGKILVFLLWAGVAWEIFVILGEA